MKAVPIHVRAVLPSLIGFDELKGGCCRFCVDCSSGTINKNSLRKMVTNGKGKSIDMIPPEQVLLYLHKGFFHDET